MCDRVSRRSVREGEHRLRECASRCASQVFSPANLVLDENSPAPKSKPGARAQGDAPREIALPATNSLAQGVALFQQKTGNVFSNLTATRPDDARVWFYAALAQGLATRDWKGQKEVMVNRGVQREIAGTLPKAEIDAAFADLVAETGEDSLAYYRRKAQSGEGCSLLSWPTHRDRARRIHDELAGCSSSSSASESRAGRLRCLQKRFHESLRSLNSSLACSLLLE